MQSSTMGFLGSVRVKFEQRHVRLLRMWMKVRIWHALLRLSHSPCEPELASRLLSSCPETTPIHPLFCPSVALSHPLCQPGLAYTHYILIHFCTPLLLSHKHALWHVCDGQEPAQGIIAKVIFSKVIFPATLTLKLQQKFQDRNTGRGGMKESVMTRNLMQLKF